MSKFRILSIDGGGLRGIVPITILKAVEELSKTPQNPEGKKIWQMFDMVAGTSTGGLIACCLTLRKSPGVAEPKYLLEDLEKIYLDDGVKIFPPAGVIGEVLREVEQLFRPEFKATGLDEVLANFLNGERLKDSLLPIVVAAYDVTHDQPMFFKTSAAAGDAQYDADIRDVCRATSAAPTYLPAFPFTHKGKEITTIDGGVFANNPAMAAVAEVSKYGRKEFYTKQHGSAVQFEDICVLSLGTGNYTGAIDTNKAVKWGEFQWIRPLIEIMMTGVNQTSDYQVREMLEDGQYLRLDTEVQEQYSVMTDSTANTRDNLIKEVQEQILNNTDKMNGLKGFMAKCEMI